MKKQDFNELLTDIKALHDTSTKQERSILQKELKKVKNDFAKIQSGLKNSTLRELLSLKKDLTAIGKDKNLLTLKQKDKQELVLFWDKKRGFLLTVFFRDRNLMDIETSVFRNEKTIFDLKKDSLKTLEKSLPKIKKGLEDEKNGKKEKDIFLELAKKREKILKLKRAKDFE